ncbi:hypothetical protein CHLNCDRAFT_57676 [Chlorella variabilis]|uniref:DNA2/NAM7 helicase-like C-terminal domain-containing protein n=1 Tax=Chlorella variabilis TaxID=554065 RepID=E1ZCM0_CHLVA|nr:hypothetical protein CHLNCDRAFT_57676 [Chlorella variabilis]EFN56459.1 hypothetical protein CHLNCDRAFT_57676 [Chlorella variabilis]|eukprot:XP_005848561.1 hypothetical protein CHLNCDRAFT_57676 [Chlorella variabilis]
MSCNILLSWDYWELERRMADGGGPIAELPTIPQQFSSVEEYVRVFGPLLLEECAAQLLRGQEEGQVLTSQRAVVAAARLRPEDESLVVRLTLPAGATSSLHENDMLLVSRDSPEARAGGGAARGPACGGGEEEQGDELHHALGVMEGHEGDQSVRVRFRLTDDGQAGNERGLQRARAMRGSLARTDSRWWALKLSSMSTIIREWAAIHCVAHMPLREVLLTAQPSQSLLAARGRLEVPPQMRATMQKTYNDSQVGRWGSWGREVDAGREVVVPVESADPGDAFGLLRRCIPRRIGASQGPKARVLVCAPSNSALDEIVLRLITLGLTDQAGRVFTPNVVRVGVSIHHSVQSVALDTLVAHRLGGDAVKSVAGWEKERLRMAILEEANIAQYRMHPAIREFPSLNFYGGGLRDGPGVAQDTRRPWHACPAFQPLVFIDVKGTESVPSGSSSLVNEREAEMVLQMYRELRHRHPQLATQPSVAVISPYKAQVSLLRRLFRAALGEEAAKMVDINTIDGFQGREKDIAFFSTVRSQRGSRGIGFVADERRINVGLTRARASLIVVGHVESLQSNPRWSALVSHARKSKCMYRAAKPFSGWVSQLAEGQVQPVAPTAEDNEEWVPQAEAHAHDAYDFSEEEGVPPFREQLSAAAKRKHAPDGTKQQPAKRGRVR